MHRELLQKKKKINYQGWNWTEEMNRHFIGKNISKTYEKMLSLSHMKKTHIKMH